MKKLVFSLMLLSLFSCADDDSSSDSTDTDVVVDTDDDSTDDDSTDDDETVVTQGDVDISSVVQEFFKADNGVTVEVDEDSGVITITSAIGVPDHKTPYYQYYDDLGTDHPLYEDFPVYYVTDDLDESYFEDMISLIFDVDGDGVNDTDADGNAIYSHRANNNTTIGDLGYVMQIPTHPAEAEVKEDTELAAIGMVLNGVPFFNNYNQSSVPLAGPDISTLDTAGGHPGANEDYHYHVGANLGIYAEEDPDDVPYGTLIDGDYLVGFMRDGFPMYGQEDEDGVPDDLDEYGGHTGVTEHFPDGIYHYHASTDDYAGAGWYVLKADQYYGTPGDFTSESDDTGGGDMPDMPEM